jgi:hypothetical protein
MAFYRDTDGAVWQDGMNVALYCVLDPQYEPDSMIGIPMPKEHVETVFGPLVEVRPTGWEVV